MNKLTEIIACGAVLAAGFTACSDNTGETQRLMSEMTPPVEVLDNSQPCAEDMEWGFILNSAFTLRDEAEVVGEQNTEIIMDEVVRLGQRACKLAPLNTTRMGVYVDAGPTCLRYDGRAVAILDVIATDSDGEVTYFDRSIPNASIGEIADFC